MTRPRFLSEPQCTKEIGPYGWLLDYERRFFFFIIFLIVGSHAVSFPPVSICAATSGATVKRSEIILNVVKEKKTVGERGGEGGGVSGCMGLFKIHRNRQSMCRK